MHDLCCGTNRGHFDPNVKASETSRQSFKPQYLLNLLHLCLFTSTEPGHLFPPLLLSIFMLMHRRLSAVDMRGNKLLN